ncbi:corticotropin-releasing factor-binding protein-like [Paramacrobiotus metropolitanus]|uniref:corticotropin-releasing factor-binding protein-like n=1 Tax=Paramacrobiotus metropolitanus TaxID=2943436 RepID=UPI0024456CDE|nr:corticotropin-releasing factor-binding protein-like [Paramacrobiotus metropolitanus]
MVASSCSLLLCFVGGILQYGYSSAVLLNFYNPERNAADLDKLLVLKEALTECVEMKSEPGVYKVTSTGEQLACGIFLVGALDAQVAIEFLEFDVDCKDDAVVGILDGWEQNGAIFPPVEDLGADGPRYLKHCGSDQPKSIFRSSGNMALVQYRLPYPGSTFTIRVSYSKNPRPCNAIVVSPEGKAAISNRGLAENCSVLSIYPQRFAFEYMDIGVSPVLKNLKEIIMEPELRSAKCSIKSIAVSEKRDYVEIRGGPSFDLTHMVPFKAQCGFSLNTAKESTSIMCGTTMVRLVSSGQYYNNVLFVHELLEEDKIDPDTFICAAL